MQGGRYNSRSRGLYNTHLKPEINAHLLMSMAAHSPSIEKTTLEEYVANERNHRGISLQEPTTPENLKQFQESVIRAGKVCVLLAAGQGSRFKAEIPKVIYPFAASAGEETRPLASYSLRAASKLGIPVVIIVGHARKEVSDVLHKECNYIESNFQKSCSVAFLVQEQQMGTGHAVYLSKFAVPVNFEGDIIITYADNPGVDDQLLQELITQHDAHKEKLGKSYSALVLTGSRCNAGQGAASYGRIVRKSKGGGPIIDIVEKKTIKRLSELSSSVTYDGIIWSPEELDEIDEFNSGIVIARFSPYVAILGNVLPNQTKFDPPKYEYYATDFVKGLVARGQIVEGWCIPRDSMWKLEGANTVQELVELEKRTIARVMLAEPST